MDKPEGLSQGRMYLSGMNPVGSGGLPAIVGPERKYDLALLRPTYTQDVLRHVFVNDGSDSCPAAHELRAPGYARARVNVRLALDSPKAWPSIVTSDTALFGDGADVGSPELQEFVGGVIAFLPASSDPAARLIAYWVVDPAQPCAGGPISIAWSGPLIELTGAPDAASPAEAARVEAFRRFYAHEDARRAVQAALPRRS